MQVEVAMKMACLAETSHQNVKLVARMYSKNCYRVPGCYICVYLTVLIETVPTSDIHYCLCYI